MDLFLIDAIGPFFKEYKAGRVNWSKIPFDHLEDEDGQPDMVKLASMREAFIDFLDHARANGFNGITIDDLVHLTHHESHARDVAKKISTYRSYFADLFTLAAQRELGVYVNTDVFSQTVTVRRQVRGSVKRAAKELDAAIRDLFESFPNVNGVVFRIGECDGNDVEGDFLSNLIIKRPRHARTLLKTMLPIFEQYGKFLIFRTWTAGAYPIGDLIWHRTTFRKVFKGIDSPHLIVSMKYGESDFFRFLPLNGHFFRCEHKMIVELQTRREYEGFGRFPSFVGWDYLNYCRQLECIENVVGVSVWCQTGGWGNFKGLTYLDDASVWNEINTYVTIKLYREKLSVEQAVANYWKERLNNGSQEDLLRLLRLSDEVIKELLYVDELATRKLFFRRLRVPPLLSVYWDYVIINHSMRKLLRCFVKNGYEKISQGERALDKIKEMRGLAEKLGLPTDGLDYQYDTFEILAVAREYYFGEFNEEITKRLKKLKKAYKKKWKVRHKIFLNFDEFRTPRKRLQRTMSLFLRRKRGYRIVDRILTIHVLSWIGPILGMFAKRVMPRGLTKKAMGIETILK